MKRKAELDLKTWYDSQMRKPLVLRGARQVGKSTLVHHFAQKHNLELIEVNFEKHSLKTPTDSLDLNIILPEIEYVTKKLFTERSLLFLDEIQECPRMITCLRFFKEERPDIAVIAAGSLLEFALSKDEISVPVGRIQYYHLGPFTFLEFLSALGEHQLVELLDRGPSIPEFAHMALLEKYKLYLYIGGMPECIQTYLETKNLDQVRNTQDSILQSYRDDFHKYSSRAELPRVRKVFDSIPRIAGHKLKYTEIDADEKSRDLKRAVELIVFAKVFLPVFHSNGTSSPLQAFEEQGILKLFFVDVGLLACLYRTQWQDLNTADSVSGVLAEQFVAQHLYLIRGALVTPSLHYWLNDKASNRAEVDFLIQVQKQIVPVEVKSGATGKLKSLLLFLAKNPTIPSAVHLGIHPYSAQTIDYKIGMGDQSLPVHSRVVKIPIYMIEKILLLAQDAI